MDGPDAPISELHVIVSTRPAYILIGAKYFSIPSVDKFGMVVNFKQRATGELHLPLHVREQLTKSRLRSLIY